MDKAIIKTDPKLLQVFENIKKSIAEIDDIKELHNLRSLAKGYEEAWRAYYASSGQGRDHMFYGWETKVRSERRMGEMLGPMEKQHGARGIGKKVELQDETPLLEDLSITKIQSHRYQKLAEILDKEFDDKIQEIWGSFKEPTTAALFKMAHVGYNSGEDEWYTPPEVIEAAKKTMGKIDLDPASSEEANKIVGADTYYTIKDNGLKQNWFGNVWMNPPYSMLKEFSFMLVDKFNVGDVKQACVYVINGTETQWCQQMMQFCNAVCFPKGRNKVKCVDKNGNPKPGSPLQGNCIFYFGNRTKDFNNNFKQFGPIFKPYDNQLPR